jgi:Ca2+-transporting ATPase
MLREQFLSLPALLLVGSATLSLLTGGVADAIVIGAVVVLNAGAGFAAEYSAERTIRSLLDLSEPEATVIHDGAARTVHGDELVPGDLLVLRKGEPVVADARLIASNALTTDEAVLTGESMPLEKQAEALQSEHLPLAERRRAIVVATGSYTEIGKVQLLLADSSAPETPLQNQMHRLGTQLGWVVCGVSGVVFCAGLLRRIPMAENDSQRYLAGDRRRFGKLTGNRHRLPRQRYAGACPAQRAGAPLNRGRKNWQRTRAVLR